MSELWTFNLIEYEPLLILIVTSIACAILGDFLVLRKLSMVADAISHSVLLGIVLAFFITNDSYSGYLVVGATIFAIITVFSIEILSGTGLVKNDDAVGIIFPLFFSIAIILITKYARNISFSTDTVLMGEVIMAPLNRMSIFNFSISKSLFQMSIMLIINVVFISIFFKELKVTTFDREFATIAGFSSVALFYALMTLTSMTTVIAFNGVGAILVISFLIAPSSSAYLICKDLKKMLIISSLYAVLNSILGYVFSMYLNVSMSGMVSVVAGITFFLTFLFNENGFITSILLRFKQRENIKKYSALLYLQKRFAETDKINKNNVKEKLILSENETDKLIKSLVDENILRQDIDSKDYSLTENGIIKLESIVKSYEVF